MQVYEAFEHAESKPEIHTIIVDSLTYLMDMYESVHVINAPNGLAAWGQYAQYFKNLMQQYVSKSTKNVIFTAHTTDIVNNDEMSLETLVKVKGSLMNNGIESFFSCVISTKKVSIKQLEKYENKFLSITEEEEDLGLKYVFQTRLTKETVNERIRGPLGLWDKKETYIDNDCQKLINKLHEYYS